MGIHPVLACAAAFSVLALACSVLAWRHSLRAASSQEVRSLLEQAQAQGALWKATARALEEEVNNTLDRVESKRRAVAGVESRLKARDSETEVALTAEEQSDQDLENLSRAELRALRRGARSVV